MPSGCVDKSCGCCGGLYELEWWKGEPHVMKAIIVRQTFHDVPVLDADEARAVKRNPRVGKRV